MANSEITRTRLTIEYHGGVPGKSGGTYSFSNLKHAAPDADLNMHARALNDLQAKAANKLFKTVESTLTE